MFVSVKLVAEDNIEIQNKFVELVTHLVLLVVVQANHNVLIVMMDISQMDNSDVRKKKALSKKKKKLINLELVNFADQTVQLMLTLNITVCALTVKKATY